MEEGNIQSEETDFDPRIRPGTGCVIVGSSGTGKSTLVLNLLRDGDYCFSFKPTEIIYIYSGTHQEKFKEFEGKIKFYSTWDSPDLDLEKLKKKKEIIFIVDDMYQKSVCPHDFIRLAFTQYNHHLSWVFILILHNLYTPELHAARSINLNSQMTIFLSSPRSRDMVRTFAYQTHCENSHFFNEVYDHAVGDCPFGYLIYDSSVRCPTRLRLRTNVLKKEYPVIFFTPKRKSLDEHDPKKEKKRKKKKIANG